MKLTARIATVLTTAAALACVPGPVAASAARNPTFAPVDRPGPALSVPAAKLDAALACTANVVRGQQTVLFVPGTTVNPREDYSWNWFRAMDKLGRPYCAVTLPFNTTGDTQIASEYVVHAIRTINATTKRKVQVIGHSQGGTEPRFALRFWPDLRTKVDDYIAFAATNHGSPLIRGLCAPSCSPALWQQIDNSDYIQAMNSYQETFAGISYTQIYTYFDQFVQPNLDDTGTTSLSRPGGHHQRRDPGGVSGQHRRAHRGRHLRPGGLRARHGRSDPCRAGCPGAHRRLRLRRVPHARRRSAHFPRQPLRRVQPDLRLADDGPTRRRGA